MVMSLIFHFNENMDVMNMSKSLCDAIRITSLINASNSMCLKKDDTLQQTMFALLQGVFCRNRIRVYPFELTPRISADHNPHHSMGFSTSQGTIQSNGSYSI